MDELEQCQMSALPMYCHSSILGCLYSSPNLNSIDGGFLKMIENSTLDEEIGNLKHEDLCEITQSTLRRLIAADPLLSDLPGDVTNEEVLAQIAVLQGQSITVTIIRNLEAPLAVVIPQQGTTVRDLKKRIQRSFDLKQQRLKSKTKISWKYIWKSYHLQHDTCIMRDNNELVTNYGVKNKSEIRFVRRLRKDARF